MCWSCRKQFGAVKTSRTSVPIPDVPLKAPDSPLLNLPPEIRNKIYSYALIEPDHVCVFCVQEFREHYGLHKSDNDYHWIGPALLQSCRQIRKEASLMYYCSNSFITVDAGQWYLNLSSWLAALEAENMRSLQAIVVDSDDERMLTISLAQDVLKFWDELQPTGLALSKDTLRVVLPVYKPIPETLGNGFPYEEFDDVLSVARIENSWIFANCLMENDDHPGNPRNVRRKFDREKEESEREKEKEGQEDDGPACYGGDVDALFRRSSST